MYVVYLGLLMIKENKQEILRSPEFWVMDLRKDLTHHVTSEYKVEMFYD